MSGGVGVVSSSEVSVVRGDDLKTREEALDQQPNSIRNDQRNLSINYSLELDSPLATSVLSHCPIQGPQALARTDPPTFSKASITPSRWMVARTCSDPGVMVKSDLVLSP